MRPTLFDVLDGEAASLTRRATPGAPLSESGLSESIARNLRRLFNTRQGTVFHLPDYGLPDPSTILRDAPDSVEVLRDALRETVRRYEPRLDRVHVQVQALDPYRMELGFSVSGEIAPGRRLRFNTTFGSQTAVIVRPT